MGLLSRFENKVEDGIEGTVGSLASSSISPIQIMKKAEKEMKREKIVGAGRQYAPTLYTVLVSEKDDAKIASFYPTLAGETETYLVAKAREMGCVMDGTPLVRFLVEPSLRKGKFDVVAELVASPIIAQLRDDENRRYGIGPAHAGAHKPVASGIPQERNMQPSLKPLHNFNPDENSIDLGEEAMEEPSIVRPLSAQELGAPELVAAQAREVRPQRQSLDIDGYIKDSALREVYLYDEERDTAYQLSDGVMRIGRESRNHVVVPDINISRVHAQIEHRPDGAWVVSDLGSTNGVFVNGIKVKSAILKDADVITLGTTDLEFQLLE